MNKFTRACEMSFNDWLSTIPDVVPEAECSKNHERWKKKLFNKMRGDRYHTFTTQTLKVMLVAAVLCALLFTAFVVPSSREFIIDNFEIFSRYKITENNKNSVNGEITVGYIPKGFELIDKQTSSKNITYNYVDSNGTTITIVNSSSALEVDFDTETGVMETIVCGNITYTLYDDATEYNCLVWTENDYIYQIHSSISKDELLKIAKTVK